MIKRLMHKEEKINLDHQRQEHIWSDYRKINSKGQVPTLKDTDQDKIILTSSYKIKPRDTYDNTTTL